MATAGITTEIATAAAIFSCSMSLKEFEIKAPIKNKKPINTVHVIDSKTYRNLSSISIIFHFIAATRE